jgi:uncharacterized protein YqgC (DUF456 family)
MPQWALTTLNVLTFLAMAAGLLGSLIPFVPGPFIIWMAALIYGLLNGFGVLGGWMFGLITVFMIAGSLADNLLMGAGAKKSGASWLGLGLAFLAGIIGTLLLPPFGGLIAAPLAIYAYEVYRQGNHQAALGTLKGMITGWGLSFAVRFGIGLLMIFFWLIWAL